MLKIGEVELEDGEGTIDFPVTLPGDSIGNLQIIAIIEESRKYGTVEAISIKDWGKPRPPVIIEERTFFSPVVIYSCFSLNGGKIFS